MISSASFVCKHDFGQSRFCNKPTNQRQQTDRHLGPTRPNMYTRVYDANAEAHDQRGPITIITIITPVFPRGVRNRKSGNDDDALARRILGIPQLDVVGIRAETQEHLHRQEAIIFDVRRF